MEYVGLLPQLSISQRSTNDINIFVRISVIVSHYEPVGPFESQ